MGRGVKQGSVLLPAFFLLVMDLVLHQLEPSGLGLSVNQFYAAGFLHVDVLELSLQVWVCLRGRKTWLIPSLTKGSFS